MAYVKGDLLRAATTVTPGSAGTGTNITFATLLVGSIGGLLIYAAVKGQNPITVLKDALTQSNTQTQAAKAQEAQRPQWKGAQPIPPAPIYKNK
jgi:uncharacterized membrane protein